MEHSMEPESTPLDSGPEGSEAPAPQTVQDLFCYIWPPVLCAGRKTPVNICIQKTGTSLLHVALQEGDGTALLDVQSGVFPAGLHSVRVSIDGMVEAGEVLHIKLLNASDERSPCVPLICLPTEAADEVSKAFDAVVRTQLVARQPPSTDSPRTVQHHNTIVGIVYNNFILPLLHDMEDVLNPYVAYHDLKSACTRLGPLLTQLGMRHCLAALRGWLALQEDVSLDLLAAPAPGLPINNRASTTTGTTGTEAGADASTASAVSPTPQHPVWPRMMEGGPGSILDPAQLMRCFYQVAAQLQGPEWRSSQLPSQLPALLPPSHSMHEGPTPTAQQAAPPTPTVATTTSHPISPRSAGTGQAHTQAQGQGQSQGQSHGQGQGQGQYSDDLLLTSFVPEQDEAAQDDPTLIVVEPAFAVSAPESSVWDDDQVSVISSICASRDSVMSWRVEREHGAGRRAGGAHHSHHGGRSHRDAARTPDTAPGSPVARLSASSLRAFMAGDGGAQTAVARLLPQATRAAPTQEKEADEGPITVRTLLQGFAQPRTETAFTLFWASRNYAMDVSALLMTAGLMGAIPMLLDDRRQLLTCTTVLLLGIPLLSISALTVLRPKVFRAHRDPLVLLSRLLNAAMLGVLLTYGVLPMFMLKCTFSRYVRCVTVVFTSTYRPLLLRNALLVCALDAIGLTWVASVHGAGLTHARLEAVLLWVVGVAATSVMDANQRRSFLRARRVLARKIGGKAQLSVADSTFGGSVIDDVGEETSGPLPSTDVSQGMTALQVLLRARARRGSTGSTHSHIQGASGQTYRASGDGLGPSVSRQATGLGANSGSGGLGGMSGSGGLAAKSGSGVMGDGAAGAVVTNSSPSLGSLDMSGSGKTPSSAGLQPVVTSPRDLQLPAPGLQSLACVFRGYAHAPTEAYYREHMCVSSWRLDGAAALALATIAVWSSDAQLAAMCCGLCLLRLGVLTLPPALRRHRELVLCVAAPLALHACVLALLVAQLQLPMGPREAMVHLLLHGFIVPASLQVRFFMFAAASLIMSGGVRAVCALGMPVTSCGADVRSAMQMSTLLSLVVSWACDYSARVHFAREMVAAASAAHLPADLPAEE